ncbi:Mechanosensitive ion channel protein [Citrus sinensis]|uniref:Mechanosensitive ion channel protein n=1 Tax=Citrus sinensis TaxID=2711 RepID=A0ACB8LCS8_CITSI|nr:Mechanosensitive ion channel protein [Citrus sinensis]
MKLTPRTPLMASPEQEDEYEEVYKQVKINKKHKKGNKLKKLFLLIEGLVACLVGAVLWMVKTFSFKLLVASRLSKRFFDQIQEAMFDEYVISTSSGPPLIEFSEIVGGMSMKNETGNQKEKEEMIYHVSGKRKKMKKISAWTMEKLINHINSTKLSIVSNEFDDCENDELDGDYNKNIESEWEAKAAAYQIFRNVAGPGSKYMDECDLLRFFIKEEVDEIMQRLGEAETGRVKRSDVTKWVVNVYKQRKSLAHYLNNSKEAMQELNRLFRGIVIVLIIIVWLLIVGLLTTKALLVILSQVVLAVFLFGNTAKNVFEAIIFLFVTHPFDVGDRCVIDGVQMVVEEMHILTTTFLRYDNEKIFYPNSVLASKPISNFYRSTVDMRDAVEFAIDVFTPLEKIGHLKSKIMNYLESKPRHWSPNHSVVVKQIKDEKMIMGLYVTHIIIFENYEEKINRRSELVLELKRIFEQVAIRIYHVVPQEVQVSYVGSATSSVAPPPES